jgi:hypothetical protein
MGFDLLTFKIMAEMEVLQSGFQFGKRIGFLIEFKNGDFEAHRGIFHVCGIDMDERIGFCPAVGFGRTEGWSL